MILSLGIYTLLVAGTVTDGRASMWLFPIALILMCLAVTSGRKYPDIDGISPRSGLLRVAIFLIPVCELLFVLTHLRGLPSIGFTVMLALVLSYLVEDPGWFGRNRAWLLTGVFAAMGFMMLYHAGDPGIDVWEFQTMASKALLSLKNPYAQLYPNLYGPHTPFYSSAVLVDHGQFVRSYPYTPITMLLDLPGYLLGDVRWMDLGAAIVCTTLLVLSLREAGFAPGHFVELLPLGILVHPRLPYLIDLSWTESLLGACTAVFVWAALRNPRSALTWIALGLLFGMKQYTVLFVPLLLCQSVIPRSSVLKAMALAALSLVPFLISDFGSTWFGLVTFQLVQPFRPDSLSAQIWFANYFGHPPQWWIPLVLVALCYPALLYRTRNSSLGYTLFGFEFILMVLVFFNKQAFFNYYWFIAFVSLCVVVVALAGSRRATGTGSPPAEPA